MRTAERRPAFGADAMSGEGDAPSPVDLPTRDSAARASPVDPFVPGASTSRNLLHARRVVTLEKQGGAMTDTVTDVLAELAALEDPKTRAVNERHGDDHGVNLSRVRALAKALKTQHELAVQLWATDDTAARLVAILVCRPKQFARDELDAMLRQARAPKVVDWLVNYVVKKSPHAEALRVIWSADPDPEVSGAGWMLTADRARTNADGLDLDGLLDVIEAEMRDARGRRQWEMNHTLAQIGISHPALRARAIGIGERLAVLKDYPTPPGCTSPYAPTWIAEMVRRQSA
jgi:3-methyladenine DNA glycosylase AlkD